MSDLVSLSGVKRTCRLHREMSLLTQSGHHRRMPAFGAKASGRAALRPISYTSQSWPSVQLALVAHRVDNLSGRGAVPWQKKGASYGPSSTKATSREPRPKPPQRFANKYNPTDTYRNVASLRRPCGFCPRSCRSPSNREKGNDALRDPLHLPTCAEP